MKHVFQRFFGVLGVALGAAALFCLPGCITDSHVRVRSVESAVMDAPTLPTAVYLAKDPNTADIYLTDLDETALDRGTSLSGVSGRIVHLHLFLSPRPGSTPIESSACSVVIRHIVLAGEAIGVYGGGGFLMPRGRLGDREYGGTIRDATLRLTDQAGSFVDRLGPSTMEARFVARRDEALARRIGARVEDVLAVTRAASGGESGQ